LEVISDIREPLDKEEQTLSSEERNIICLTMTEEVLGTTKKVFLIFYFHSHLLIWLIFVNIN
jgi:hypothetical protein